MDWTGNHHMELGTNVIILEVTSSDCEVTVLGLINFCRINIVLLVVKNRLGEKKNLKEKEG